MTDENNIETKENESANKSVKEETQKETHIESITLESLANDVAKMKNDFNNTLKEKDNEINTLKEYNNKLEKTLNEQNALIGNFRESLFNNTKISPEIAIKPDQAHLDQCYKDAFKAVYHSMKHRILGENNENSFINKCMEVKKNAL